MAPQSQLLITAEWVNRDEVALGECELARTDGELPT
jgi:hypothetical protein